MTSSKQPIDVTENLVAYLDGELTDEQAHAVQLAIAQDPQLRQRVDALQHTWQMLGSLPEAKATGAFTQQTMETVQLASQTQPQLQSGWPNQWRHLAQRSLFILGITVSATLGFLLTNRWMDDDDRLLLQDYSVIRHLDQLADIGNTEFLQALDSNGWFDDRQ